MLYGLYIYFLMQIYSYKNYYKIKVTLQKHSLVSVAIFAPQRNERISKPRASLGGPVCALQRRTLQKIFTRRSLVK